MALPLDGATGDGNTYPFGDEQARFRPLEIPTSRWRYGDGQGLCPGTSLCNSLTWERRRSRTKEKEKKKRK